MNRIKQFFEKTKRFFRELRAELRKVVWPTRKETMQYTMIVVSTVAVISLFIWVIDSVFSGLLRLII
jgi:preprotein translocase subunit SecE